MNLLRKITSKKILYIVTLFILIFLPVLKQTSFYLVKFNIISNYDSINCAYILYLAVPFLLCVYIINLIKTKRKLDIYDYLLYILIFAGVVATIFAIDKEISLFGKVYRHEGLLSVFSYYLLFITWKIEANKEDIKKLLNLIIFMAIINSIYALFQIYTPFKFILRYGLDKQMASGISGNPNFFGSLIVTALGLITSKFLIEKTSIKQILLVVLLFISLINAQSTGPFITYIITILFLIVYLFIKKKLVVKNVIYLILILLVTNISIVYINKEGFKIDKCEMCDFAESISNESEEQYTISNGRIDIWKNSLNIVKKNLINGVGYDNFYLAYYEGANFTEVVFVSIDGEYKAVPKYYEIIDNAHNVYLQTLISSGLIGLIPYLVLCLLTFIKGLKSKNNLIIVLLGGFVSYSIQAFGNINVIQVTPIYYIIIGLILSIKE